MTRNTSAPNVTTDGAEPSAVMETSVAVETTAIAENPAKFYKAPTVTLLVGKNEKPFYVHVGILCDASPFFKAAFKGSFKESFEKTLRLPEDEEGTLDLFVDWLYYRRCEMLPEEEPEEESEEEEPEEQNENDDDEDDDDDDGNYNKTPNNKRFEQLFRLFAFAGKYEILELKRLVIETLFAQNKLCRYGPPNPSIVYAYEFTTQGSGLRKMLADWHAWKLEPSWFDRQRAQAFLRQQPDFAVDVCLSFANKTEKGENHDPFAGELPEMYLN